MNRDAYNEGYEAGYKRGRSRERDGLRAELEALKPVRDAALRWWAERYDDRHQLADEVADVLWDRVFAYQTDRRRQ